MAKKDPVAIKALLGYLDALLNLKLDYQEIEDDIRNFGINMQNLTSKKSTMKKTENNDNDKDIECNLSYIG